jgi:hypothetical protein
LGQVGSINVAAVQRRARLDAQDVITLEARRVRARLAQPLPDRWGTGRRADQVISREAERVMAANLARYGAAEQCESVPEVSQRRGRGAEGAAEDGIRLRARQVQLAELPRPVGKLNLLRD